MDLEVHIIIEIFGAGLLQVRHLWRKSPGLVFTTRRVGKNSPGLVGVVPVIRGRGRCAISKRIRDAALYTIIHPSTFAA